MSRTHVTSVINQDKFCINKTEEHELHKNENIYVLTSNGLVHASVLEIFEEKSVCKAEKANIVKVNDIVIAE
ncbi:MULTISPECIES: hypothetical protein [Mammaliicoccus]|uniref:Uncharacterized protein n=1 Tax=Mammaliicoccus fleurettii TaxID=150056 RepID=A0ABS5MJI8_9STAP|nr:MULTISPECIES: hypothetical protein [Mammaliicoccus]HCN61218.1 hypothetical protein [Staphylococcus sp.]MBL0846570.1 hypothetical protein [Mammaliicoccus fleurettii]MBO3062942.1 hypothetical protein [Mammaliicoccus fleurettii]MBS3671011.1 hypothetical protein [Mammaliicoccus fleurettii]MBS3696070.1 hypothetical protein [Mammaliicoccus fleurettii]